jgi:calpain-5
LNLDSGIPTPCFSRTEIENEVWVSLLEKAYAKLCGGYQRLSGCDLREVINDLTGLEPEFIPFDKPENVN